MHHLVCWRGKTRKPNHFWNLNLFITLKAHSHFIIAQYFISATDINAKEYIITQQFSVSFYTDALNEVIKINRSAICSPHHIHWHCISNNQDRTSAGIEDLAVQQEAAGLFRSRTFIKIYKIPACNSRSIVFLTHQCTFELFVWLCLKKVVTTACKIETRVQIQWDGTSSQPVEFYLAKACDGILVSRRKL